MHRTFNASRQVLSDWGCGIALSGCWCAIVRSYSGSRGYQRGRKNLRAAGSLSCMILTVFFFVLTEAVWEVYLFAGSPMFSDKVEDSAFSKVTEVMRCGSNTHVLQSFADSLALKNMHSHLMYTLLNPKQCRKAGEPCRLTALICQRSKYNCRHWSLSFVR